VDDTPANLQLLSGMLKDRGCKVRPVPSGEEALQAARRIPPDLILLDINMPGMSGYEVCHRLKEDPNLKSIPVLFISALSETADKVKAFAAGGVDYVTKPFQMEEVYARVETHLRLRQLQRELERQKRELHESYRAMFENAVEGIYQSTPEGRYLAVNPALAKLYGYDTPEELLLEVSDIQRQIYVDPSMCERFRREIENRGRVQAFEYRVRRRDGRILWISESARVARDVQGVVVHYEGFIEDITARKEAEAALRHSQQQLVETSRQIGMAEMATSILHNLGNALNSVNVSAGVAADQVRKSNASGVAKVAALMNEHAAELGPFLTNDPKGRHIPQYLVQLGDCLAQEKTKLLDELNTLRKGVEHANSIVAIQQNYAKPSNRLETVPAHQLVEDAFQMTANSLARHEIRVARDYAPDLPEVTVPKHTVLQILLNLIRNAQNACDAAESRDKRLTLAVLTSHGGQSVRMEVRDNGVGMSGPTLAQLFDHGFTTRKDGHGFGLYSGSVMAKELGGSLSAHSDGLGKGARFVLEFPCQSPATRSSRSGQEPGPTSPSSVRPAEKERERGQALA